MNVDEYVAALMKSNADLRKSNLKLDLTIDSLCNAICILYRVVQEVNEVEKSDKLTEVLKQAEKALRDSGRLTRARF
jgi:hypothetical protein